MKHIVTSCDQIHFVVESDARSVVADQRYARARASAELAAHSDFFRINSLDDVGAPFEAEAPPPPPPSPVERRAAFRLISGGRRDA